MDTKTILQFIDKTISKTKSDDLSWKSWNPDFPLKLLPSERDGYTFGVFDSYRISFEDSYLAPYKTGYLLLLVCKPNLQLIPCIPPENCTLTLRMQDDQSKFPVEIANSTVDENIATALIRLYNLIDKSSSSVTALINDFLNS